MLQQLQQKLHKPHVRIFKLQFKYTCVALILLIIYMLATYGVIVNSLFSAIVSISFLFGLVTVLLKIQFDQFEQQKLNLIQLIAEDRKPPVVNVLSSSDSF
jgi:hypothetical protein